MITSRPHPSYMDPQDLADSLLKVAAQQPANRLRNSPGLRALISGPDRSAHPLNFEEPPWSALIRDTSERQPFDRLPLAVDALAVINRAVEAYDPRLPPYYAYNDHDVARGVRWTDP